MLEPLTRTDSTAAAATGTPSVAATATATTTAARGLRIDIAPWGTVLAGWYGPVFDPGMTHVASAPPVALPRGGTRWRRSAAVGLPAAVVAGVLVAATLRGPLPLNLVVSGQNLKLTSNGGAVQLPKGLTLYPSTIKMKNGGDTRGVMIAGLPEAVLTKGLCISLVLTFPMTGTWTVRLHTTGRTTARDMTLDAAGINVGLAELSPGSSTAPINIGGPGGSAFGGGDSSSDIFAVAAPGAGSLSALQADAQGAVIAGSVHLAGLHVRLNHGSGIANGECY
jgi:hypothetical protein